MADALFLSEHPSWSARDLAETDQTVLDYLDLIHHESAALAKRQNEAAERESRAAAHRARLGRH
jgi:hypothetical protein